MQTGYWANTLYCSVPTTNFKSANQKVSTALPSRQLLAAACALSISL